MSDVRAEREVESKYEVVDEHGVMLLPSECFVLRDTDLFGPAVLWSYVHAIQTHLEQDRIRRFLSEDERAYLQRLEQMVQDLAEEWQRRGKGRLPD